MAVDGACDVDDAVDVVGHGLEGEEFDLGVIFRDVEPCLLDLLTQGGELDPWGDVMGVGRAERSQQGAPAFDAEGHHVNGHAMVVVAWHSALHGGLGGQLGVELEPSLAALAAVAWVVGHWGLLLRAVARSTGLDGFFFSSLLRLRAVARSTRLNS